MTGHTERHDIAANGRDSSLDTTNMSPNGLRESLFDHADGEAALHRLEQTFYDSVLRDPLLQPLFGAGRASHVEHLTLFTAESFGGPGTFSRELDFDHLIRVHRGLNITE